MVKLFHVTLRPAKATIPSNTIISMKQKLKDLLKKKNKPTFDEAAAYFTAMTDAQKAVKKGGVTDDPLNRNSFENTNFGLVNNNGFNPTNNNLGRGSNNNFGGNSSPQIAPVPSVALAPTEAPLSSTIFFSTTSSDRSSLNGVTTKDYLPKTEAILYRGRRNSGQGEPVVRGKGSVENPIGLKEVVITAPRINRGDKQIDTHPFPIYVNNGLSPLAQGQMNTAIQKQIELIIKANKRYYTAPYPLSSSSNIESALQKTGKLVQKRILSDSEAQESDHLRTAETTEALAKMDSSEFVNRYLKEIGLFDKVPSLSRIDYLYNLTEKTDNKLRVVGNNRFMPQAGDIYVTKRNSSIGIVKSYDAVKDTVTTLDCHYNRSGNEIFKEVVLKTDYRANFSLRTYYSPVKTHVVNPSFIHNGSTKLSDAMTNMISCIDLAVSGAAAAAKVMQVSLPKFMGVVGKVSYLGPLDNVRQMTIEGFNWNDATQAAAGTVLIGFSATLGAPVVLVGTLGLFAWELGETYVNQQKN